MAGEVLPSLFTFDLDAFPAGGVGSGDRWGDDAAAITSKRARQVGSEVDRLTQIMAHLSRPYESSLLYPLALATIPNHYITAFILVPPAPMT